MDAHEMKRVGWNTEEAFRKMLDDAKIPYLPFCDAVHKFSPALRNIFKTKRPDIMILLRYVGFIIIDIKHKKMTADSNFLFDCDEAEKYGHFRESFGHEVWFAISDAEHNYLHWYLIPSLHVVKNRKEISTKTGNKCYVVPSSECIKIAKFQDLLEQLFSNKL